MFYVDKLKVKQIDTVECQQLVIDIINSVITDPRNIMTVRRFIVYYQKQ